MPVVGACLLQAGIGWVYSPMERIDPFKIQLAPPGSDLEGLQHQMLGRLQEAIEERVEAVTGLTRCTYRLQPSRFGRICVNRAQAAPSRSASD